MELSWVGLFESFASRPFGGNVAGVVITETALDDTTMLGLASDLAAPTTGFVARNQSSSSEAHVRFFTPTQEIDACGHVTIAVAQALHDEAIWGTDSQTTITCAGGNFPISRSGDRLVMRQTPRTAPTPVTGAVEMASILGIPVTSVHAAATGLSHLFVEVEEAHDLSLVVADHGHLERVGRKNGVDTIGVFARLDDARVRLRDFTAPIGVLEEPASGTTSGALGSLLGLPNLVVEQGVEMGRPSELVVTVDGDEVTVAGSVRRVFSGRLD